MRPFSSLLGLFALATLTIVEAPASAAEPSKPSARLVYGRGGLAACPDEATLKSIISVRLGYDPFDDDAGRVMTAAIRAEGKRLLARIEFRDASLKVLGGRTLTSETGDCEQLISAVALVISIAIDPMSSLRPPPPPPASPPPPAPAPAAPHPSSPAPEAPPPVDRAPHEEPLRAAARVGVEGGVAFGVTPDVAFAPALFAGVELGNFSIDVEGRLYTAGEASAPRGSVTASLLSAGVAPCVHLRFAFGCGVASIGRLAGTGDGVDVPSEATTTYADVGGRIGVELPLSRMVAARAHGDVRFPLVATELYLRDTVVWSTPTVTGAVGAGLVVRFR